MTFTRRRHAVAAFVTTLATLVTTGCGLAGSISPVAPSKLPVAAATSKIGGQAYGGNSPIVGATVQLYAAGQSATGATGASGTTAGTPGTYGAGYSALTSPVQTDSNGAFNITQAYTCPATTPDSEVYIVATAGNPGMASGTNNLAAVTIAALGSCTALQSSSTFVQMNEVTTTATIWALQQFMSADFGTANVAASSGSGTNGTINFGIGAPSTNVVGMDNAFAMAQVLANYSTGSSPGTSTIATVESAKINSIADILSACINTTGSTGTCQNLETAATPSGSPTAADVVQIGLYMAKNPANNVSSLFVYGSPQPPFVGLTAAPTDWTVGVQFAPLKSSANALGGGFGIAADTYGNIWISQSGNGSAPAASVVELGPTGALLLGPVTSYTTSATKALAADMTTAPTAVSTSFASPTAVVIDSSNNAWVANTSNVSMAGDTANSSASSNSGGDLASGNPIIEIGSVAEFAGSTASGTAASGTVTGYYGAASPSAGAADGNGNVFFISADTTSGNDVSKVVMGINNSTFAYTETATATGAFTTTGTTPSAVVVDQNKTYTGAPNEFSMASGSCPPYGNIVMAQTKLSLPLTVNTASLSSVSFGSTGGSASTFDSTTERVYCGSTVRQSFAASVQNMYGMAVDASSNIWVTNTATTNYTTFQTADSYTDYTVNAMTYLQQTLSSATINTTANGSLTTNFANLSVPKYVSVDGNNNAWVVSTSTLTTGGATGTCSVATPCNSISEFATPSPLPLTSASTIANLSGTYGFVHTFYTPGNLTIDLSGNVWVVNTAAAANYVTVLVGAAGPVLPPSYAIASSMLGLKP